jgi:methylated-DNA-[protein]-cysteine S-methyltransferase
MTPTTHRLIDSPVGPLTLIGRGESLAALYMGEHRHAADPATYGSRHDGAFPDAVEQLGQYFAGERTTFELRTEAAGTPFQLEVWEALGKIPYGSTCSYGQLAERIGRPGASRAVGLANGRNPISIIVPCHRVIGANGSLTGYGGGVERKAALLALERGVSGGQLGLLHLAHGVAG